MIVANKVTKKPNLNYKKNLKWIGLMNVRKNLLIIRI